jgi:hypothetical protein
MDGNEFEMSDDVTSGINGFGPGFIYYLNPDRTYISAALVLARLTLDTTSQSGGSETETKYGVGLDLSGGMEFAVSPRISIGAALQLYFGSMEEQDIEESWSSTRIGILGTISYRSVTVLP